LKCGPIACILPFMKSVQVHYEGRVQGVGFRWSVKHLACGFDIAGSVKNLPDGRVELLAQGEETDEFLEAIRTRGSPDTSRRNGSPRSRESRASADFPSSHESSHCRKPHEDLPRADAASADRCRQELEPRGARGRGLRAPRAERIGPKARRSRSSSDSSPRMTGRPRSSETTAGIPERAEVGFLPENPYFYKFLSAEETLRFYGKICGLGGKLLDARIRELIELVGLQDASHRRIGGFSKSMLQRIGLAQALVQDPKLVILDEPTAGVDPSGSRQIRDLILDLKKARENRLAHVAPARPGPGSLRPGRHHGPRRDGPRGQS